MWLPFDDFKRIYSRVPKASVDMVIRMDGGVVMVKRTHPPSAGTWHLPGGTILFGELVEDAARRLARDEVGLEIDIIGCLGYMEYPKQHKDGYFGWPVAIVLEARARSGELRGSEWQGKKVAVFKEMPENTLPDQADFILKSGISFSEDLVGEPAVEERHGGSLDNVEGLLAPKHWDFEH